MFNDLMENIEWFFNLHDKNNDGFLTRDDVLTLSESLLVRHSTELLIAFLMLKVQFIFRFEVGDAYLGAISRFMSNAFEYGDALMPQPEETKKVDEPKQASEEPDQQPMSTNQPYLNLATYVSTFFDIYYLLSLEIGSAWLS